MRVRPTFRPVIAIAVSLAVTACAARNPTGGSAGSCADTCAADYKECAYGSQCMMVQECILEICIPAENDCKARCDAAGQ
jgi:hypothetical protein